MKYLVIIFLLASSLLGHGQSNIIMVFNDWGFCGPGPIIQEELSLFSDGSFEYVNCHHQSIRIEANGRFVYIGKNVKLEYDTINIDTLYQNPVEKEKANIQLISEFRIARDKAWLENEAGMLYECGKHFRTRIKIFEQRKRRVIVIKTIEYKAVKN
jgi:hypothetical protein